MTTPCTRFEQEGLPALLRGEALDEHFTTCAECRVQRARYGEIEQDLAALGASDRPPPDYQARVWARIAQRRAAEQSARPWYRRWWWLVLPIPAALAALLPLPRAPRDRPLRPVLGYAVAPRPDAPPMRGQAARPGDVLSLEATTAGNRVAELRVYRGDRALVLRCTTEPPCERQGDALSAAIELPGRGDYHVLLLTSSTPLPAPLPALAQDIAAAEQAGAVVERGPPLVVR